MLKIKYKHIFETFQNINFFQNYFLNSQKYPPEKFLQKFTNIQSILKSNKCLTNIPKK